MLDVCQSFDCGPVLNPENLRNQMEGAIIMGLGPALREEMQFADGAITNASFRQYRVPRFKDVPKIEVHAMNRTRRRRGRRGRDADHRDRAGDRERCV